MPLYKWIASDLENNIQTGVISAASEKDLKLKLRDLKLNLLDCSFSIPSGFGSISFDLKAQFFNNLSMLIESGVLLPQALELIVPNISNKNFRNIIADIAIEVSNGELFSECLKNYRPVFTQFMIQITKAGQESGNLSECLKRLSEYLELKGNFYKKIRSSLALPIITFIFFIFISLIIFIYIIPSFSLIDSVSKNHMPSFTKNLIQASLFLRYVGITKILFFLVSFVIISMLFFKSKVGARFKNFLFFNLPLVKNISNNVVLTIFLRAASIMLNSGVSLNIALKNTVDSLENNFLKNDFMNLALDIEKGQSLSEAMKKYKIFPRELIAMMYVAQESGNLPQAMNLASNLYYQRVIKYLNLIVSLIQPTLIIFMGILIAILIGSVYLPIVQMPMSIEFV
jgi:type IV pilus assembly protein PilC